MAHDASGLTNELEQRLIELETLVAFHEETISQLSSASHEQQRVIDDLKRRLTQGEEKLRELPASNQMDPDDESQPPHY